MEKLREYLLPLGLASGLVLLLVAGISSVRAIGQITEATVSVERGFEVLTELDDIGGQVDQVITTVRVFVLTGTEEFVEPLDGLYAEIDNELENLGQLVADNPAQLQRLQALRPLVEQRLAMSEEYVAIRRENSLEATVELIPEGGERLANEIRAAITDMTDAESGLLAQRQVEARNTGQRALITDLLAGLSSLVVLGLTFMALRRQVRERTRAEESLRTSEERLRLVIKGTNDGIWDWNILTEEQYISSRLKELLGYDQEEIPSSTLFDLVHPDDHLALKNHLTEKAPFAVIRPGVSRPTPHNWSRLS